MTPLVEHPRREPHHCYVCNGRPALYMVRDEVWFAAFPNYAEVKSALRVKYPGPDPRHIRVVELCFDCLATALGRPLRLDDFDLSLPVNFGIRLGVDMLREELGAQITDLILGRRQG